MTQTLQQVTVSVCLWVKNCTDYVNAALKLLK
jgi:hypothetical protein